MKWCSTLETDENRQLVEEIVNAQNIEVIESYHDEEMKRGYVVIIYTTPHNNADLPVANFKDGEYVADEYEIINGKYQTLSWSPLKEGN